MRSGPTSIGEMQAEYAAAKASRFRRTRTVPLAGSGADYHYRSDADYLRVMEYARDMDRNDAIISPILDRAADNTVGEGFKCDPQTGDAKLDEALGALWKEWTEDPDLCDEAGELCFADMERMVFRQSLVDGDMFGVITEQGTVQLIEAHRCRTPAKSKAQGKTIVHGVEMDDQRRRMRYWFTADELDPMRTVRTSTGFNPIDVRDESGFRKVCHVYWPKRATQTRGVTALSPVFDVAGMFEDLNFAKIVQAQVVSCIAFFRYQQVGAPGFSQPPLGAVDESQTRSDGTAKREEALSPGKQLTGRPGEKIEGFSPGVPNSEFFPHVKLILQLIGVNLGLPLVVILLDGSETNFSGWRGAFDQAKVGFKRNQQSLVRRFHQPIWDWKVANWIAEDGALRTLAEKEGVSPYNVCWSPPTWPYIEPLKDASADLLRLSNGLISPRRLHAERGRESEEIAAETIADNSAAIKAAITEAAKLTKETGVDVHWREILPMPNAQGITISLNDGAPEPGAGASDATQKKGAAA